MFTFAAVASKTGFTTPAIEMKVTSSDGNRVENVSIAKSGENYIAKREGEPVEKGDPPN